VFLPPKSSYQRSFFTFLHISLESLYYTTNKSTVRKKYLAHSKKKKKTQKTTPETHVSIPGRGASRPESYGRWKLLLAIPLPGTLGSYDGAFHTHPTSHFLLRHRPVPIKGLHLWSSDWTRATAARKSFTPTSLQPLPLFQAFLFYGQHLPSHFVDAPRPIARRFRAGDGRPGDVCKSWPVLLVDPTRSGGASRQWVGRVHMPSLPHV
jgi:hypothetical protein